MKLLYVLVFVIVVCYVKASKASKPKGGSVNATKTKHTGKQTMHEKATKLPAMKAAGMRERELVWVKVPHAHARWILV